MLEVILVDHLDSAVGAAHHVDLEVGVAHQAPTKLDRRLDVVQLADRASVCAEVHAPQHPAAPRDLDQAVIAGLLLIPEAVVATARGTPALDDQQTVAITPDHTGHTHGLLPRLTVFDPHDRSDRKHRHSMSIGTSWTGHDTVTTCRSRSARTPSKPGPFTPASIRPTRLAPWSRPFTRQQPTREPASMSPVSSRTRAEAIRPATPSSTSWRGCMTRVARSHSARAWPRSPPSASCCQPAAMSCCPTTCMATPIGCIRSSCPSRTSRSISSTTQIWPRWNAQSS